MPKILPTNPDLSAHSQTVELDGEPYQIRFYWRGRQRSWYMDLRTVDGDAIALGRRLSAQSAPLYGQDFPQGPPGLLLVRGPAYYQRKALGRTLVVKYYPEDEVGETDDETPYTVALQ